MTKWHKQQNILFIISLLDELMEKCTTSKLFKWCAEQKDYWQEEYGKI